MVHAGSSPPCARPSGGFALVAALLLLVGLSALAGGGLLLAGAEASASRSQAGSLRALLAADGALAAFLDSARGMPAGDVLAGTDTPRARTETRLEARRLLAPDPGHQLWRAVAEAAFGSGKDRGRRRVSRLYRLRSVPTRVPAALTALTGLEVDGTGPRVDGRDPGSGGAACAGLGAAAVAGVAAPPGAYGQEPASPLAAAGAPDTLPLDPAALPAATGLEWEALLADPGAFDVRLPGGTWPPDEGGWPAIAADVAELELDATRSGRGLLAVRGDLVLRDGFRWEGTLLAGGRLIASGDVAVAGTVLAGLSGDAGIGPSRLGPGPVRVVYDACAVARAGRRLAEAEALPLGWSEAFSPWRP